MTDHYTGESDPFEEEEELTGPARYCRPGEELLIYTPDIQIKKFRFDAYLTDSRLFLTDPAEKGAGVTAKEIPRDSIVDCYIEHSPAQEPILVLSIQTSEDDVRTMKLTFVHTGKDRVSEAEEWMHLIKHSGTESGSAGIPGVDTRKAGVPPISPEARALSETFVFQPPPPPPPPSPPPRDIPATPRQAPPRERPKAIPSPAPEKSKVQTTQIQFCFHCGHRIPPAANFCPYCGTRMISPPGQGASSPPQPGPVPADTGEPEKETRRGRILNFFRRKKKKS